MSLPNELHPLQLAASSGGYEIEQSLRFDGSSGKLTRTNPASSGITNAYKWSYSFWIKHSDVSSSGTITQPLLSGGNTSGSGRTYCGWGYTSAGRFWIGNFIGADYTPDIRPTDRVWRDPSAWEHFMLVYDTSESTNTDRIKIYSNGVRWNPTGGVGSTISATQLFYAVNYATKASNIGYDNILNTYFDGYMAEVHFVDGQALDQYSFGEFDTNGAWRPIKYTGTYGLNGHYLKFDPSATNGIGHDHSGNGNNFSPTGFSTTAGTGYDVMSDTPTNNWATLNPLTGFRPNGATGRTYSDGNLVEYTPNSSGKEHPLITTTQFVRSADGGVYQFEDTVTNSNAYITFNPWMETENVYGSGNAAFFDFYSYSGYGTVSVNTAYGATGTVQEQGIALSASDVVTTVVDLDNNTVAFYVNGTRNGYITGCNFSNWDIWSPGFAIATGNATATTHTTNFGQQPFQYTPVAGAKPWSTAELPAVAIKNPSEHFQTILDSGSGILSAAQTAFPNGLWWIKDRASSNQHQLVDSVRGGNLALTSPNYEPESSYSAPAGSSVAWCWDASSPTTSGFEILTWSGNSSAGRTISHTLGKPPEFIIIKSRTDRRSFAVYHKRLGTGYNLWLDDTTGTVTRDIYQSVGASSIALSADVHCNATGDDYVSYLWTSVPGYSSFGSYVGNGSIDGPFVFCGFRPQWILLKPVSVNYWMIFDTARTTYNPVEWGLFPNDPIQETYSTGYTTDLLSNGFKLRTSNWPNSSGTTVIFAAFAEHPLGGANVSPATAR